MSYPSIDGILGSDAHTAALAALYNRRDWPGLARYWYAHQHKPALRAAIRILFFDRENDPTLHADERAARAALAMGLNIFLTASNTLGMLPIGYFGQEDKEARLTIDFLNLLSKVDLCELAMAQPVQRRTPLMSAGLTAAMDALRIAHELHDLPSQGFLQSLIATTFSQLRQFDSARKYFSNAIDIRRQLLQSNADVYSGDLALTLMNYSNFLRDAGELEFSRDAIVEAVSLYRHAYSVDAKLYCPDLARSLGNVSVTTRLLGNTTAAIAQVEEAIALMRAAVRLNARYRQELASLLLLRANIGGASSDDGRAREYMKEGTAILQSSTSKDAENTADGGVPVDVDKLSILAEMIQSHLSGSGNDTALPSPYLQRVRQLARKQPVVYRPLLATLLTEQGIAEMRDRRLDAAEQHFTEAASLFDQDSETRPFSFLEPRIRCWMGLGIILDERSDAKRVDSLRKTNAAFRRARDFVEQLRGSFLADAHRDRVHEETYQIYEFLFHSDIALWMASGDHHALQEAVEVAEASRARRLNDQIAAERLVQRDLPEHLREHFLSVRRALHDAETRLYTQEGDRTKAVLSERDVQDNGAAQRITDLEAEIVRLRKAYRETVNRIRRDDPAFEPDRAIRPISFDQIRQSIPEDKPTAIIQFVVGDEKSVALITTKHEVIAVQLPEVDNKRLTEFATIWRDTYQRRTNNIATHLRDIRARREGPPDVQYLRRLHGLVAEAEQSAPAANVGPFSEVESELLEFEEACIRRIQHAIDDDPLAFRERDWALYVEHLLQPVSESAVHPIQGALRGVGIKRLIISANRGLHVFPLHACRLDRWEYVYGAHPIGIRNFQQRPLKVADGPGRYFGDAFEIIYTPSLSILFRLALSAPREGGRIAVFSDPTYNLPFSEVEAIAVQAQYSNNSVYIGNAATKTTFLEESRLAPIIQFCGHAIFNPADPLSAALVLGDGASSESLLTLREIFSGVRMNQTWLAVLSGCETGMLIPDNVDEYVSLSGGFLYAGASCVVSTLWEVDDFVSALLMCRFHYELNQGSSIGTALGNSQRWLRDEIRSGEELEREVLPWLFIRVVDPDLRRLCKKAALQHAKRSPVDPPFRSPAYWAAFSITGWGFDSAPLGEIAGVRNSSVEMNVGQGLAMASGASMRGDTVPPTDTEPSEHTSALLNDRLADLGLQAQAVVSGYISKRLAQRELRKRSGWLRCWAESGEACKAMFSLLSARPSSADGSDARQALDAGMAKFGEGHIVEAISDFEDSLRRSEPFWTDIIMVNHWALGMAYLAQGRSKESLQAYESAMSNSRPEVRENILKGLLMAVEEHSLDCLDEIAEHLEGEPEISGFIAWQEEIERVLSNRGPATSKDLDGLLSRRENQRKPGLDVLVHLAKCRVAASAGARSEMFACLARAEAICGRIDSVNRSAWHALVRTVKTGCRWQVLAGLTRLDSHQVGLQLILEDEFETALVCFRDAATRARAEGNAERLTESLIGITWCLVEVDQRKESREHIAEACQLVRDSGNDQWREIVERLRKRAESEVDIPSACTLRRRAQAELNSGQPEEATCTLVAALRAAEDEHNLREQSRIRFDLIGALIEAGRPLEADDAIDAGLKFAQGSQNEELRRALVAEKESISDFVVQIRQIEASLASRLGGATDVEKARMYVRQASDASDPRIADHFANQALMATGRGPAQIAGEALVIKAMAAAAFGNFENAKELALRAQSLVDDAKILGRARSVLECVSTRGLSLDDDLRHSPGR